jgi:hypothetical protein
MTLLGKFNQLGILLVLQARVFGIGLPVLVYVFEYQQYYAAKLGFADCLGRILREIKSGCSRDFAVIERLELTGYGNPGTKLHN